MAIELNIIFSAGVGLSIFSLLYLIYEKLKTLRFNYGNSYEVRKKVNKVKRFLRTRKAIVLNKKERIIILAIVISLIGTVNDAREIPRFIFIGLIFGLAVIKIYQKTIVATNRAKRLKEAAILFEAIEMYLKSGYSLYQAVRASRLLVDDIRPAVDKCLNYWGAGAEVALQKLQEELKLEEIDTLILLLINMEQSGTKELEGTIDKVVFNIEDLQKMKTQIKIANRPLIFVIYRMLPLISTAGIVAGGLLYRMYHVLELTGFVEF